MHGFKLSRNRWNEVHRFCSNKLADRLNTRLTNVKGIGARNVRGGGSELGNSKILTYASNYDSN
jgi:hypothetical protein